MTTVLVWLKDAGWGGRKVWADCTTGDDAHTRASTLQSGMAKLSDGSVEGDWRLPTKSELVEITVGDECIWSPQQMYFFTNVASYDYWSSTTEAIYSYRAWGVDMFDGYADVSTKNNSFYVWPVRGGY